MSSYIIAGSADSIDTAYCEELARRIKAKYKNIDFRIVIKHASEWEDYLQQIRRIYGFLRKSNPIIYTFDGKIIGGREQFVATATKYFGLDEEELVFEELSSKINVKLADEEVKQKNIQKSGFKTIGEKIELKYKELLGKGIMKYGPKEKENYLVNGIEYIHIELEGLAQKIKFRQHQEIDVVNEEVEPEDINLAALSIQDQVKPDEPNPKEAFVTANDKGQASDHDRLSEASKTGKMHESIVSYDKDSKGVKESGKDKLRIDEEFDDVPDFVDEEMKNTIVCELADQFFVAFDTKSIIGEELIFYLNVDQSGNTRRLYNDNRPIKGHRVVIREVHYEEDPWVESKEELLQEIPQTEPQDLIQIVEETKPAEKTTEKVEEKTGEKTEKEEKTEIVKERRMTMQLEKSKTEPNIYVGQSQKELKAYDVISEPNSDLHLISNLNHHTLFIHKPLSPIELKNILYFVRESDSIATLQFLPENPNPRVKLHVRKMLMRERAPLYILPIEQFIIKQLEDKQYREVILPYETSEGQLEDAGESFKTLQISAMGFNHLIYQLGNENEQKVHKVIKFAIDHVLSIEEQIKRDIGYNLVITKQYIMVVPLVEPYEVYNGSKLYLDGLAFMGCVHTAKLVRPYEIAQPVAGEEDKGAVVRKMLAVVSGCIEEE